MVVFLADRCNVQIRQLHRRIKNRFQSDDKFDTVQFRVSEPREPGPYRVVVRTDPRQCLEKSSYPVSTARIEIGFQLPKRCSHEFYWFNWIEPDRDVLLGWHRDDTHSDLGPTHLQVNQGRDAIAHEPAQFIDKHPMAVVEARLRQLPSVLEKITWKNGSVGGIDW